MDHYRRTSHSRFDIKLHFVWTTKYRKPILTGSIATRARDLVRQVCTELEVEMLGGHVILPPVIKLLFSIFRKIIILFLVCENVPIVKEVKHAIAIHD